MPVYFNKATKKWDVRIHCKGYGNNPITKTHRGLPSKEEAIKWEQEFLRVHKYNPEAVTVKDYYSGAFKNDPAIHEEIKSDRSWATKDGIFNRYILPRFGNYAMSAITEDLIKEWLSWLDSPNTLSESTKYNIVAQFKKLFHHAEITIGIKNPITRSATQKIKYTKKPFDYWTPEEYLAFRKAFVNYRNIPHLLAVDLIYYGGLAKGECAALSAEDVENNTVHVRYSKVDTVSILTKSPSRFARDVSIPEFLSDALNSFIQKKSFVKNKNPFLFQFSFSSLEKNIKDCAKTLGIKPLQLHEIQCSYVFLLKQQGVPSELIAMYTGTSLRNVSDRYKDLLKEASISHFDKLYPESFFEGLEDIKSASAAPQKQEAGIKYTSNNCPYGYMVSENRLEINPREAEVVRLILGLYKDGNGMRMADIAQILDEKGYKNRAGQPFRTSYMNRIWQNKSLYDGSKPNIKGLYDPIVSSDDTPAENTIDEDQMDSDIASVDCVDDNEAIIDDKDTETKGEEVMTVNPVNESYVSYLTNHGCPYGFTFNEQSKEFLVIPSEAVVVYTVFSLYYKQDLTVSEIQLKLNNCGYRNRRGHYFDAAFVSRLLSRDFVYCGSKYKYRNALIPHDPIINSDYSPYKRFPDFEKETTKETDFNQAPEFIQKLLFKGENGDVFELNCSEENSIYPFKTVACVFDCFPAMVSINDFSVHEFELLEDSLLHIKGELALRNGFTMKDINITNKQKSQAFTICGLIELARSFECKLALVTRENHKVISVEYVNA